MYVGRDPHVYIDKYTITGKIDFIFSPSELDMKRCFGHTALHSGKDAMLNIGLFRLRMRKLLGRILNYGELNKDYPAVYADVVLDMPPGSNEYSDALLREIWELAAGDKAEVIYYNVTTMDRGHMYATADYIADLWKVSDEKQQIRCVFSEMAENEFGENFEKRAVNFSVMMDNNESFSVDMEAYYNMYMQTDFISDEVTAYTNISQYGEVVERCIQKNYSDPLPIDFYSDLYLFYELNEYNKAREK